MHLHTIFLTLAMGRKRNKGKARRAAKGKVEEEEAERRGDDDDYQATNPCEQSLSEQMQQVKVGDKNVHMVTKLMTRHLIFAFNS